MFNQEGGIYMEPKKLYRSTRDRKITGVCGGLAQYFNVDSTLVRVLFILFGFFAGGGLLAYIIMALIIPIDNGF